MDSVSDSIDFFYVNRSLLVHEPYPTILQRDEMLFIKCPDRLFESFLATTE